MSRMGDSCGEECMYYAYSTHELWPDGLRRIPPANWIRIAVPPGSTHTHKNTSQFYIFKLTNVLGYRTILFTLKYFTSVQKDIFHTKNIAHAQDLCTVVDQKRTNFGNHVFFPEKVKLYRTHNLVYIFPNKC